MTYDPVRDFKPNRIALIAHGRYAEAVASVAVPVGAYCELDSTAKIRPSTSTGRGENIIALEDAMQGLGYPSKSYLDPYAIADVVPYQFALPGDVFKMLLAAGQTSAIGSRLMSLADGVTGALIVAPTGTNPLYNNVADSATITNTTAETDFSRYYDIPASFLQVGDVIRVRGTVRVPSGNSTDTLTLKLKIGSQVVIATAAVDVTDGGGDVGSFDAYFIIRTVGASGTFIAGGTQSLGVPGTVTAKPFSLGSTAIDTTAVQRVKISATWSAASTSDQALLSGFAVYLDRQAGSSFIPCIAEEVVDNSAGLTPAFVRARFIA